MDGYTIDVMWKVRNNTFKVWGDVEDGEACWQITLHFYFSNPKQSGTKNIETFTEGIINPKEEVHLMVKSKYIPIRTGNIDLWTVSTLIAWNENICCGAE